MSHQSTVICDHCGTHHMMDDDMMELPPNWIGTQFVIADSEGMIPPHEREVFEHFCSIECIAEYLRSETFKNRFHLADESDGDDNEDFDEDQEIA